MAPRSTRRQRNQDDYSDESDDSTYKRKKHERKTDDFEKENIGVEESEYYLQAIEESKKQQENGKLLVQTELRMRLDMVKRLAKFEEDRINQFFNEQKELLKKQIVKEMTQKREKQSKKSRPTLLSPSLCFSNNDSCFSTQLTEEEMVSDLLAMSDGCNPIHTHILAIPLSNNRLLMGDIIIQPHTPCHILHDEQRIENCEFVSALGNEVVLKIHDRDMHYPISLIRNKSLQLELIRIK